MKTLFKVIKRFLGVVLSALVAVNAVTICVSVFCRFVINSSLGWPDELAAVSLAWITFLGAALATVEDKHIAMEGVREKLGAVGSHIASMLCDLAMLAMTYVLMRYGTTLAQRLMGDRLTSLPIPKGIIYGIIPFSAAIMALALLYRLWEKARAFPSGRGEGAEVTGQ